MGHAIRETRREGFAALELLSPAGLTATLVPDAGMVCASLRLGGRELLGQRRGLAAYAREGATMGIPLLYPWANRLARYGYAFGGVRVAIPQGAGWVADDGQGLPIHGLVPAWLRWQVTARQAAAAGARLGAELDSSRLPELAAAFPFPHRLSTEIALCGDTLEITTTLRAGAAGPVPVAFGYHPYFRLPDLPRSQWEVKVPARRRARLDARLLPTGASEPWSLAPGPLGDRVLNDLLPELEPDPVFALAGAGWQVEVAFGPAYPVAVVWAPADDDVVCFEPMTAPTNPFEGGTPLRCVAPGGSFTAGFRIRATRL